MPAELAECPDQALQAHRLVNSRFPPIDLFNDVADAAEFEALYQIQALTNPRVLNEVGRIELIALQEISFAIAGCSYATAPFTHVNPAGSRFSNGSFGVLYLADEVQTAVAEVRYHQQNYYPVGFQLLYLHGVDHATRSRGSECQAVLKTGRI
ncbi:hypothetical protein PS3A_08450 [Pseudomonas sp. 3A(2025)]